MPNHRASTSPLVDFFDEHLRGIEGIGIIYLEAVDVVRHRLVKEIIEAYATADEEKEV